MKIAFERRLCRVTGAPLSQRDEEVVSTPIWPALGWRQAVERVASFLDKLRAERDGERVLVIGHSATRLGLEVVANGGRLEELVGAPFTWQPGWDYRL